TATCPLSLHDALPILRIVATELSEAALEVARRNVSRHGLEGRVRLARGSWWEPLAKEGPFDVLVSNPPYVDPRREDLLAPDVKRSEEHTSELQSRFDL